MSTVLANLYLAREGADNRPLTVGMDNRLTMIVSKDIRPNLTAADIHSLVIGVRRLVFLV